MKTYGFIFARGGSKGLPLKNIRPLCGKPLIAWAIEAGKSIGCLEKIIVSTDNERIAEIAREYGAQTPFLRPAVLASDTAAEKDAWIHAIRFLKEHGEVFDEFVSLPCTAPLRTSNDILRCLDVYRKGECDMVITCTRSNRSPYFNMITLDASGYAHILMNRNELITRRQDAPPVFDIATVAYVTSPEAILKKDNLLTKRVQAVEVERINALDIDDLLDFEIAEFLMRKRLEK